MIKPCPTVFSAVMIISMLLYADIRTDSINRLYAADVSLKNEQIIKLWPGIAPGSETLMLTERIINTMNDLKNPQRSIEGISIPAMTAFVPKKSNGASALIFPGGEYTSIAFDKEGVDIARWLNTAGITAFVLKSRLPGEGHLIGKHVPLQDAQRAMRIIRSNAERWKLDTTRIGVVGLSSGGHLASMLATNYAKKVYLPIDDVDEVSAHPEWCVVVYPQISGNSRLYAVKAQPSLKPDQVQDLYDEYPTDRHVSADSPRTFIVQGNDDTMADSENSVRYYLALHKAGVPAELHIFVKGAHGFAIANNAGPIKAWSKMCEDWMKDAGILK
jgi:acetyl esterase/lipase